MDVAPVTVGSGKFPVQVDSLAVVRNRALKVAQIAPGHPAIIMRLGIAWMLLDFLIELGYRLVKLLPLQIINSLLQVRFRLHPTRLLLRMAQPASLPQIPAICDTANSIFILLD